MRSRLSAVGMSPDNRRSADHQSARLSVVSTQFPNDVIRFRPGDQFVGDLAGSGDSTGCLTGACEGRLGASTHDPTPHFPSQRSG
jgi:hypothetical protein